MFGDYYPHKSISQRSQRLLNSIPAQGGPRFWLSGHLQHSSITPQLPMDVQMETSTDRREQLREATETRLEINWADSNGVWRSTIGSARDSSPEGLSGVFPDPVPVGHMLSVKFIESGILSLGVVRHSTPVDGGFLIGVTQVGDLYIPHR